MEVNCFHLSMQKGYFPQDIPSVEKVYSKMNHSLENGYS